MYRLLPGGTQLVHFCLASTLTLMVGCSLLPQDRERTSTAETTAIMHTTPEASQPRPVDRQPSPAPLEPEQTGYYMDVQFANLQQKLKGNGLELSRRSDKLICIIIPGAPTFDSNSADIKPVIEPALSLIAEILGEFDKTRVIVRGHTDDQGNPDYNLRLSEQRAAAIGRYFRRSNIAAVRLVIQGVGQSHPIADNTSPEGRARNRRVELLLEPIVAQNSSLSSTAYWTP